MCGATSWPYPAGIAITWVSSARAQQRMPVIGYLDSGSTGA